MITKVDAHISAVKRINFTTWPQERVGGKQRSDNKSKRSNRYGLQPTMSKMYFLSQTMDDVKIYDLENFHMKYELSHDVHEMASKAPLTTDERIARGGRYCQNFLALETGWDANTRIISAGFVPHTDKTYITLSNDTIQVWNWRLRTMRQAIQPLRMRSRYLRHFPVEPLEVFYDPTEALIDDIVVNMTRTNTKHVISDVQFSRNGVYCSVSLQFLNEIIIFFTSTSTITSKTRFTTSTAYIPLWDIYKVIKLHDYPILRTRFISPWLPPSHPLVHTTADAKYLLLHSVNSVNDLIMVDVDNLNKKVLVNKGACYNFDVSSNGKMLAIVLDSIHDSVAASDNESVSDRSCNKTNGGGGEILVYNLQHYFDKVSTNQLSLLETLDRNAVVRSTNVGVSLTTGGQKMTAPMARATKRLQSIKQEVSVRL